MLIISCNILQNLRICHSENVFLPVLGCDLGDVGCSDRHAFQRLVRGPFKSALSVAEEGRIKGVPDHIKHAVIYFHDLNIFFN